MSWAFARRPELCEELFTTEKTTVLHGCSVVQEDQAGGRLKQADVYNSQSQGHKRVWG